MQGKKHIVQLSFVAMIVSLILFTILEFRVYPQCVKIWICSILTHNAKTMENYLITIFSGIFTGAILSLFVAIREYMDAKTYDLVGYYKASSEINRQIYKIPYLDIRQPYDLVEDCIAEEDANKRRVRYNEQLKKAIDESECLEENKHIAYEKNYEKLIFDAKEKMQEYIWAMQDEKTKETLEEIGQKKHFLEQQYDGTMREYHIKIDEIMKYYIEFGKIDYWNVEDGYGKINFLLGNKKRRNIFIYENLHDKKRKFLRKIREIGFHFQQYYQEDVGNLPVQLSKIIEVQKEIFTREDTNGGYTIYNTLSYTIDRDLTTLLKMVYGKKYEVEIPEKKDYVVSSVIMFPYNL